jgi:hypothetical protein
MIAPESPKESTLLKTVKKCGRKERDGETPQNIVHMPNTNHPVSLDLAHHAKETEHPSPSSWLPSEAFPDEQPR